MLNISTNSIQKNIKVEDFSSYRYNKLPRANRMLSMWLTITLIITIVIFFLPWTQNIQMKGKVTTLLPEQRPQDVNSAIAGRIEKWYVREGELVQAGDTVVFLSEVKSDYFDPNLVERTGEQIQAKQSSIVSYEQKAQALQNQISAMKSEAKLKKGQLENKLQQAKLKLQSNEAAVEQAKIDYDIADFQYRRTDTLYQKGIKSLNDLEGKRLKVQSTKAKLVSIQNKLLESQNDIQITQLQLQNVDNEYSNKISKAQSDRFSTLSNKFDSEGSLSKLQNQYTNYSLRNDMYYVIAPQSGYITKAVKSGIGEMVKEGDKIVSIVPYDIEMAVEMYVKPMDMPLIKMGQEVQFIFDGWQAFIVSGWTNLTFGTFSGEVVAIDNVPNESSEYRIMVKSNDPEKPFPEFLRVGTGAKGIALLKDVPVWYEIWRQLNGFPPDFYQNELEKEDKFKPPVKSVAK